MRSPANLALAALSLALPATLQAATPKPRITEAEARAIAHGIAPGTIVESDYERENGAWRYSFDIREGRRIREIGVDATSGKVVEDTYEKPGDKD